MKLIKYIQKRFGSKGSNIVVTMITIVSINSLHAQASDELAIAQMKLGKIWAGVTASGGKATFEYRAGFFPNDFEILGQRGQYAEGYTAAGITFATTNWYNPDPLVDSLQRVSIYSMVNEYAPIG